MAQRTKQSLDEVKLTLRRLQRITSESAENDGFAEDGIADLSATEPAASGQGRLALLAKSLPQALGTAQQQVIAGVALVAVLLIAVAGAAFWLLERPVAEPARTAAVAVDAPMRPPAPPVAPSLGPASPMTFPSPANPPSPVNLPPTNISPATPGAARSVAEAQGLIDGGKVSAGRQMLTGLVGYSPEAALMLARSYDPNFLRQISQPDAAADAKEAERWYRAWHASAAQNGLVMEPDRLERIIKAMR